MVAPLSNVDVLNRVDNCKFLLYEDMDKIQFIDELFPKTLILYQLAEIGHFCSVFLNNEGVNFFDPLGHYADYFLSKMPMDRRIELDHDEPYLLRLLSKQNKPVIYNNHRLQKANTNTCGHWNTIRLIYSNLFNDEFYDCFKDIKDKDKEIVRLYDEL